MNSSEWKKYKLEDIADFYDSKRVPLNSREREKRKGKYPYYGASGIVDYIDSYLFDGEHVLISEDGENLRSRQTPIAFKADSKFWVNNHAHVVKGKEQFLNDWIVYFFQNLDINPYITGAVQPKLNKENLQLIEVSMPDFEIAKKIISILSALDEKIELNRQANVTLESMAGAIFKEWFVENMEAKNWKEIPLPEAIDFLEGPGIRNWQYTNSEEGIRFINIRCIQNRDVNIETANRINEKDVNTKYMHFLLQEDDIVVSTSGTLGRFAIIRKEHLPLLLNTSVIRMRPIESVTTWSYLIGYIESEEFQFELESRATGSVQKNFGPMHLKQMKMLIPPADLLNKFEKAVQPLHRKMLHNFSEILTLTSVRDALLPKLMSGEVAVHE